MACDTLDRRIAVDEVRRALAATGMSLKPHVCLSGDRSCGCVLGVLMVAESPDFPPAHRFSPGLMIRSLGLHPNYGWGLIGGFDHGQYPDRPMIDDHDHDGYRDGIAIRKALVAEEDR